VLASLRDTLASGSDVVQITATDGSGHTAVRTVGVQIAAAAASPGGSSPGTGPAAFQGNGMLVVGGVQAAQVVAGNLQIGAGGNNTLLAALAPSAYSTASLTVGGTFEVLAGGTARFTGTLGAPVVQVDAASGGSNGGTLSGGGTLSALGGGSIVNNGRSRLVRIHAGAAALSVTNTTGTGTLAIDAGATLPLGGTVASSQAIQFAPNTAAQFANGPYSPSTLVLAAPLYMFGAISGFTFADRLVLQGVTAVVGPGSLTRYTSATQTLTIQQQAGPTLTYSLAGSAPGDLAAYDLNINSQGGQTVVSFVRRHRPVAPSSQARRAGGRRRGGGPGAQHRPQHAGALTDGPRCQHPGHRRADRGVRHALGRQRQRQYRHQRQQHQLDRALRHAGRGRAQPADADLQGGGRGNHPHRPFRQRLGRHLDDGDDPGSTTPPRCSSTGTTPTAAASAISPTGPSR
jgi:hypothetical protein